MLLTSLVNLYEILADKGKVDKPGWSKVRVSYGISIDRNGNLVSIKYLKRYDEKRKKDFPVSLSLPMQVKRASNIAANFICDTSNYFFGIDAKGNTKRSRDCFEASKKLHKSILRDNISEASKAIINFFDKWNIERCEEILDNIGCTDKVKSDIFKKGATLVLMPLDKKATDYGEVCEAWDSYYNSNNNNNNSYICSAIGKKLPVATLHPSIKGVYGAQPMGTSLVSFNAHAFESFEKKQGMNSFVSEYAAFAYTTALNYLLSETNYVNHFGDTTVVCWTENDNEGCQDIMTSAFGNDDETTQDDLWGAVKKISSGESVDWKGFDVNPNENFYILGLSPNAARLSVRFFLQNTFGNFMKNIIKHEDEMNIVIPHWIKNTHFPIWRILKETVNSKSKNKSAKPQLAGDLLYSVLTGYKYPETLFNNIMIRIKAERSVDAEREAIRTAVIKAYLLRNHPEYKEELTVKLDKENTNHILPYNLGRLFAILEEIQMAANPEIKSTINDKYFTSASSTPAMVFPLLIDLAQKHLKKIKGDKTGYCVNKQKQLTSLFSEINEEFPSRMTMQEKGIFQIGYYHQTQERYSKKEEK